MCVMLALNIPSFRPKVRVLARYYVAAFLTIKIACAAIPLYRGQFAAAFRKPIDQLLKVVGR
jgi:hypothetical protein